MKSSIDHEKIFFNYFLTKPHYLKGTGKGFFANSDLDQIAKYAARSQAQRVTKKTRQNKFLTLEIGR